jgi:hypothetical protein
MSITTLRPRRMSIDFSISGASESGEYYHEEAADDRFPSQSAPLEN